VQFLSCGRALPGASEAIGKVLNLTGSDNYFIGPLAFSLIYEVEKYEQPGSQNQKM
jgi:hypothetical protein